MAAPAVLLIARRPGAGPQRPELAARLGAERHRRLERLPLTRAAAWAAEVAPGRVHAACEPGDGEASLGAILGPGVELLAPDGAGESDRLRHAAQRAAGDGPLLIVWPELPRWRPGHAAAALTDLRDGCPVSVGPVFDGGLYLLALARPHEGLFQAAEETWHGPAVTARLLGAAHELGLEAGMLRAERGLHRDADVRAALADPLLDAELAALLRG